MCCTFNTSREALNYVGNHYAEILKQADQHHARIIDIVTPEELRNFLKILQEILAQNYPYEENDVETQSGAAALYTAISSATAEIS